LARDIRWIQVGLIEAVGDTETQQRGSATAKGLGTIVKLQVIFGEPGEARPRAGHYE
jgi:hypothetical protein